jgi:hypothetical protein
MPPIIKSTHRQDQEPDASDTAASATQTDRRLSLKDLLLSHENRFDIELSPRGVYRHRPIIRFEED